MKYTIYLTILLRILQRFKHNSSIYVQKVEYPNGQYQARTRHKVPCKVLYHSKTIQNNKTEQNTIQNSTNMKHSYLLSSMTWTVTH